MGEGILDSEGGESGEGRVAALSDALVFSLCRSVLVHASKIVPKFMTST